MEPTPTTITLEQGQEILAAQPFSRLLGTRLAGLEPGRAVLELDLTPDLRQQHGAAHGGVVGYLADNSLAFAGGSVLGPAVMTGGYAIEYLRPGRGGMLRATATVVSAGRRRAVCRTEVHDVVDGEAVLCAAAQGTIVVLGNGS